ncbi:low molecular weight phosphatase family protein [Sedimentimonas flavescens]|uniref:Low molecular weight phosphatase family protein n=1 Tax=Sedimentimonas flavescens TaxID=2851012 RepID=A0ABT3A167_9RHOB|nr:low molecular weight phosphatase family protein [Sedimentimonas flavescens]MCV2879743.1 low molecular weight phosphatase family protein [Sedimentimonas flavescens]WBL33763.1 low molecular weight phosphatase family protein [Sinirhodobacter sp. HNIBRBA609]
MMPSLPHSVLFCCDHNATRSPMAEGVMKKLYGREVYVQSAGVKSDLEIDGFTIAVCHEIGVDLTRHRSRDFNELSDFGDSLESFDLVIALTPASRSMVEEMSRLHHVPVEFWPITDPTGAGENREARLAAYRATREQIRRHMIERFGPPKE